MKCLNGCTASGFSKVRMNCIGVAPPGRHSERPSPEELLAAWIAIHGHMHHYGLNGVQEYNMLARCIACFEGDMEDRVRTRPHCELARVRCRQRFGGS